MAMRECDQCLENSWTFQPLDGDWMRAYCRFCGYEVEWEAKKKPQQVVNEDTPCRHCGGQLQKIYRKEGKKIQPSGIYFLWWFRCRKCEKMWMVEEAKRTL